MRLRGIGCARSKHMPYKRKQKGSEGRFWWASSTDAHGKRIRLSTGTTQKREAVTVESKWKAEAFQQQVWGVEPDHSLDEMQRFILRQCSRSRLGLPVFLILVVSWFATWISGHCKERLQAGRRVCRLVIPSVH